MEAGASIWRGGTVLAHHFNNARVAQCIEHRASNAEVAGEIPAASTTHFSRRSPTAEAPTSNLGLCECNCGSGRYAVCAPRLEVALPRWAFSPWAPWNVNRTSEPGLFAKEIVAHFA